MEFLIQLGFFAILLTIGLLFGTLAEKRHYARLREDEAAIGHESDDAYQAHHHHRHHHQSLAFLAPQSVHRATASRLRYSSICSV